MVRVVQVMQVGRVVQNAWLNLSWGKSSEDGGVAQDTAHLWAAIQIR